MKMTWFSFKLPIYGWYALKQNNQTKPLFKQVLLKTMEHFLYYFVAERTSYFCLARKLIWPLWSTHIFTQWGWLILFSPDHFSGQYQIWEGLPKTLFLRTFSNRTDVITVCSLFSISITTPWGKSSNLWTSWVYSFRPSFTNWLWIRWIQSVSYRNNFKSPSTLAMSTATRNNAQSSSHFISRKTFLETFCCGLLIRPVEEQLKQRVIGILLY